MSPRKYTVARHLAQAILSGAVGDVAPAAGTSIYDPEVGQYAEPGQGPYSFVLTDDQTGRMFRVSVDEINAYGQSIPREA